MISRNGPRNTEVGKAELAKRLDEFFEVIDEAERGKRLFDNGLWQSGRGGCSEGTGIRGGRATTLQAPGE